MTKFAQVSDVSSRWEGPQGIPTGKLAAGGWVELRITDVENALMGLVPSLRKSVSDINADSVAAGDPDRLGRVTSIVANKVLDLYRNPGGASSLSQSMEGDSVSTSFWRDVSRGSISFTPDELNQVRLRTKRSRVGTVVVSAGRAANDWRPWGC